MTSQNAANGQSAMRPVLPIDQEIARLKEERNAIILAHNYTRGEVQDIADFLGDSLGLSRTAASTKADVIVFCGVHFMAETASILSPEKRVLMPDANSGCAMANMVTPRELAEMKAQYPEAVVVTYVNSSAAIKAMSDVCCTSANALEIVSRIPGDRQVLFVPDRNLGHYTGKMLNRDIILWDGFCPTHQRILLEHVMEVKKAHPEALFVAHPECRPQVLEIADFVASTTGMLDYCAKSPAREFIIGTEIGLLYRLEKDYPEKRFYPASLIADCSNMKLPTLAKIKWCLEELSGEVRVPAELAELARKPIERMLDADKLARFLETGD